VLKAHFYTFSFFQLNHKNYTFDPCFPLSLPANCCLGWMERWIAVKVCASLCDLSEHNDSRSSSPPDREPELIFSGSSYAYSELLTIVFIFWSSGGTFCNNEPRVSSPWWWRQYATLKCWSTLRLHGATSQKALIFNHVM
jgi:hypothetical protein